MERKHHQPPPTERTTFVRIRKRPIRARVKGDLSIAFTEEALTAHDGLELIRRFLDGSGFIEL